ncbi:MAG: hypothetical protein EFKGCFLK_02675 [Rhodocyclaceae bacterium]|nr:hypothetical protein [Rhodocyclaceae bacterium]MCK6385348.1 PaaI family thioesterase [Rhodocyclaceae bacterium]CAG0932005.1 acyl-coenzyme A thioesterase 13 [Rhodocyclaceae bacterium]
MSRGAEALKQEWLAAVGKQARAPGVMPLSTYQEIGGLEIFQRMLRGELPSPPIAATLDFALVEVERGRIVFQGHPAHAHLNPIGTIHGGWQATLLDSCMACAVQTELEVGQAFTSLEIKVNFLRALTDKVGPVRAEGRVIQVGRQIGIAEGSLYDAAGKLYAHGTTTCLVFHHENLKRI